MRMTRVSFCNFANQSLLDWSETFEFEDAFHPRPFFAILRMRGHLLEFVHELFPPPNRRIGTIKLRLLLEREMLIHIHDHEHACAEQIDFHRFNPTLSINLCNFWPNLLMMF